MKLLTTQITRTLLPTSFLLVSLYSQAAAVCVTTSTGLKTALDNASISNIADEIRISKGTFNYTLAVGYSYGFNTQYNHNLTISGGWNSSCSDYSSSPPNPADTVLVGGNSRGVFSLVVGGTYSSTISISNLTLSGGYQAQGKIGASALEIRVGNSATPEIILDRLIIKNNANDNVFAEGGSAIRLYGLGNSEPIFRLSNSLISGNTLKDDAAIRLITGENTISKFYLTNNTITNNVTTGSFGGGLSTFGNSSVAEYLYLDNNVIWSNKAGGAASDVNLEIPLFTWSSNRKNHIGVLNGTFNYSTSQTTGDPKWTINAAGIPIPNAGSPLINSGIIPVYATSRDLLGATRVQDNTIDRGAIEIDPATLPPPPPPPPDDIIFQDGFEG